MKALKNILVESQHSIKTIDELKKLLDKFPNDATSWKDATDEIRDIAHLAVDFVNEFEKYKVKRLDFNTLKTPADWNSIGKAYIMSTISGMTNNTLKRFLAELNGRFE